VDQARTFGLYLLIGGVPVFAVGVWGRFASSHARDRASFAARRALYMGTTMLIGGVVMALVGVVFLVV
jgi:uncharacterized membrane protein YiaA